MSSSSSIGRIMRFAVAGAVGGLLTYLLVNPSMVAQETPRVVGEAQDRLSEALQNILMLGIVLGGATGAALIAAEEAQSHNARRLLQYSVSGLIVGAICGLFGSVCGQLVFSLLLGGSPGSERPPFLTLVLARAFGWAMLGAAAGLCPGVVSRSSRRIGQGMAGGLVGGGIGGLLFDTLSNITQGGSVSRLVGFIAIGALVGALVSLVEEVAKEYWLTSLTGSREGRSFILSKPVMALGRHEMADIPLFGDMNVARQHARLVRQQNGILLTSEPGLAITINGQPTTRGMLQTGDIIGIATHRFRFSARRATTAGVPADTEPLRSALQSPSTPAMHATTVMGQGAPAIQSAMTHLDVIAGPHTGTSYPVVSGAILGRDPRCDIALIADPLCSRQHARLIQDASGWRIEDGGSANGTWLNGQRVFNHPLQSGDEIRVGITTLKVR